MRTLIAVAILAALGASAHAEPSAAQLYDEGQRAFDQGDYATAVARWRSSYQLSRLPLLVLNVAQAYRLVGDCESALGAYRQYVALDPTSGQRALAEGFIGELEPRCGQPVKHAEVPPVAEASLVGETRRGHSLRLPGLATGGTGAALVATGLWLGYRASKLGDEVSRACSTTCNWNEQRGKDADGRRDAAIGYVLDTVGVAAIAGGAIMYYVGTGRTAVVISPQPREGGGVVTWSGSW